ncbi:MAG TPA: hypothetical protein VFV95_08520 [Vicinamibacterales bacterium]|nr:hypothetical protein [Vicinamibacterales bacterium]
MNTRGSWVWIATAVAVSAALLPTLSPGIVGLFHDDAIYVATAKSLADGDGYHLANLPGAPVQTKYPPFFPGLLALLWKITPGFPQNVLALKSLNLVFIAILLVAMVKLIQQHVAGAAWPVLLLGQLVLVTNPGMVSFADFTMTDVLFTTLVTVALALWGRGAPRAYGGMALLAIVAIALLTRSVGISLVAAIVFVSAVQRRYRESLVYAAVAFAIMASWTLWGRLHRGGDRSVLVDYYQTYETPAIAHVISDPALAWQIVIGNCRMAVDSLIFVLGPVWTFVGPLLLAVSIVGVYRLARSAGAIVLVFTVCYLGTVLLHPFAPHRYLLPLMPVFVLCLVAGASWPWQMNQRARSRQWATAASTAALAIVLAGNLLWLRFTPWRSENVRGWYGMSMGYTWSGFEETFAWIRQNTDPHARLAGLFDPMYFLYTGRQAVRPWFHRPESYFYPYGNAVPFVGRAPDVARELRALGVEYLVLDPPKGYAEGAAAVSMLRALVTLPEVNARRVFVSADGQHEVYRLWHSGIS